MKCIKIKLKYNKTNTNILFGHMTCWIFRRLAGMLDSRRLAGMLDSRRLAGMLDSRRPDGMLVFVDHFGPDVAKSQTVFSKPNGKFPEHLPFGAGSS